MDVSFTVEPAKNGWLLTTTIDDGTVGSGYMRDFNMENRMPEFFSELSFVKVAINNLLDAAEEKFFPKL